MLLYGKLLAEEIKNRLKNQISDLFGDQKKYVAILFFGDNSSSSTYVKHKQKYASEIWLSTVVFWQQQDQDTSPFSSLIHWINKAYNTYEEVLELIAFLNEDKDCIGIMIQLPLPEPLASHKLQLLQAIDEKKDIDGLWGSLVGKSFFEMIDFIPATPRAVLALLDAYQLGDLKGKKVAIIWQSTIVGKPLALECIKRGAIVQCFDIKNTPKELEIGCRSAEYVFSWTGVIHLINDKHINEEKNQILVDIGYGHTNGKPVGDIDFESVKDKVKYITPVPGGVWPLTIASLFSNLVDLVQQFHTH